MTWVLILIAGWITAAAVAGLFAWSLSRSAAIGDRDQLEQVVLEHAIEADASAADLRVGPQDRRAGARPWATRVTGRRAEDVVRRDIADAERALSDAQHRLAEIEGRQTA